MRDIYSEAAIAHQPCPCCGAKVGQPCHRDGREILSTTHWARRAAMREWRKAHPQEWAAIKAGWNPSVEGMSCGDD
jgi:hypothetical protein